MAKYIKTKDYVYDTEKLMYRRIEGNKLYRVGWDVEKPTFEADIIKQSDSIEELCDRFVLKNCDIIFLNKEHTQYRFEGSDEWYDITDVELRVGIYGAIWTDIGLIYVAKMNEKGELELI